MVAFDPPVEPDKDIDDLEDKQIWELVVPGLFAGFALVGVIVKYGLEKDDAEIRSAWKLGDLMAAEFMRRVKEKVNGR